MITDSKSIKKESAIWFTVQVKTCQENHFSEFDFKKQN
jgi:hypothetical protein